MAATVSSSRRLALFTHGLVLRTCSLSLSLFFYYFIVPSSAHPPARAPRHQRHRAPYSVRAALCACHTILYTLPPASALHVRPYRLVYTTQSEASSSVRPHCNGSHPPPRIHIFLARASPSRSHPLAAFQSRFRTYIVIWFCAPAVHPVSVSYTLGVSLLAARRPLRPFARYTTRSFPPRLQLCSSRVHVQHSSL